MPFAYFFWQKYIFVDDIEAVAKIHSPCDVYKELFLLCSMNPEPLSDFRAMQRGKPPWNKYRNVG